MLIAWTDRSTKPGARCPVCGHAGAMAQEFSYRAESLREVTGGDRVAILRCPACEVRFCDPLTSVDYHDADARGAKFYLESGAGIDVMLEALALADDRPVKRYLEIGCAFGFIMDYARRMLGWEVRGFDPGALARLGRDTLHLPIENGFFQSGTGFDGWADLVFCSEVIEHIPDPAPFLDLLCSALPPEGQLILTTPNGDALAETADPAVLSAILSPGHHIVLYNPASIAALLKRHGFTDVRVEENGFQLRVVAARTPMKGRSTWFDRGRYSAYLAALLDETDPESPLGAGLAYRLFKEQVNGGRYDEARTTLARLRDAYRSRYGLDLDDPAAIPMPPETALFEGLGERWPFNLTGVLYFQGILLWLGDASPAAAADSLAAAARFGQKARRILRTAGVDDLEMADLVRQAGLARLSALAQFDPAAAAEALQGFVDHLPDDDAAPARRASAREARRRLFLDLVNLGHLDGAEALVDGDLVPGDPPAPGELPLAFALGLVRARQGDGAAAARLFGAVAAAPETSAERRHEAISHHLTTLVRIAPDQATEAFLALDGAEPARPEARRRLFADLVNLGHGEAAERVLGDEDLPLTESPADLEIACALARHLLNHRGDYDAATPLFDRVWAGEGTSEDVRRLAWQGRLASRAGGGPEVFRLFRRQVNEGRYAEAAESFAAVREACLALYAIDLADPAQIPQPSEDTSSDALLDRWPLSLSALLYLHGLVAWLERGQPAKAAADFHAAVRFAAAAGRILGPEAAEEIGLVDFARQAGLARLSALAQYDPRAAVEALLTFVETLPDDAARETLGEQARRRLFTDLVNLGHFDQAEQVLAAGGADMAEPAMSADLPTAFALALFRMNRQSDFAGAAALFGQVADTARDAPSAADFFWTARFHQGMAVKLGGLGDAGGIAAEMRDPPAGLPPVPEGLLNRLDELA